MTDEQKVTMWLGAFRYYLGRMTYAVSDFCDLLIDEWPNLPERLKKLIKKEIDEAFEMDDQLRNMDNGTRRRLGMECDREEWERVRRLWSGK